MLSNSAFRDLLTAERPDKVDRARDDSKQAKAARAAKAKAGHERRMQIQKRKEEALAEQAKYRDRAEERRKEIEKQGGGIGPTVELDEGEAPQTVPSGPTFAQVGNREDLSQQKHRLTIAQSKYLGGDIEHTHLVKGLDYALLQKRRAELSNAEKAEEAKRQEREAQRAARTDVAGAGRKVAASLTAAAKGKPSAAGVKASNATVAAKPEPSQLKLSSARGDMARGVLRALSGPPSRPNRSLASGRLVFVFDVSESAATDKPTSLVRAEDDLGIVRPRNDLGEAALQAPLMARLSKVMAYVARNGAHGAERGRKPKKEKPLAPSVLVMRPLKLRSAPEIAAERSRQGAPTAAGPPASASAEGAKASLASSKKGQPPPPPLKDDVDDIFGDGSGSDYVCKPSDAQMKQAEREKRVKEALRKEEGSYFDREEEDDEDAGADMDDEEGPATGEASSLLSSVLGGEGGERRPRASTDGEQKQGKQGAKPASKDKNKLAMGSVASDSYAECFPESYEGYNLELHGPDSDDEASVVRSTRKGEEEDESQPSGKSGKGGKRVDREALKKEAKMSRDLVQIERLIDERKKKRQRGEGDADDSHVDQNELF